jgi:tRNA threonylcarbamoyladenosine biosynthesis protein TsaE
VERLLAFAGDEKIMLFDAPMGAGKTTLIKSICTALGVVDVMSSPTYSIVNEYHTATGQRVFHFDLYRLKNMDELYGLGFEEYAGSGQRLLVEWPGLAVPFFDHFIRVSIEVENDHRYLYAEKVE